MQEGPDRVVGAAVPFVVGCGRSGTTLLRSMLDSHPDIAIPGENDFLLRELEEATPFAAGQAVEAAEVAERLARHPRLADALGGDLEPDHDRITLDRWFRAAYGRYAAGFGKARFGDKTPGLVLHIPRLAEALPEAVFLHVVRDGRDVALAFLDQEWGPSTVPRCATVWRRHVEAGRRAGERLGPRRYLEVRYEDLVEDPEAVLRRVVRFIGVGYAPEMLAYGSSATRAAAFSTHPGSHDRLRRPPTKGLRDWRRDMATVDRIRFESIAGDCLRACSYPLGTPGGRLGVLAVRVARRGRAALGRMGRRRAAH